MTYKEFVAEQTEKAFRAILNDSDFKRDFMSRLSDPNHYVREWEEEIINRLMTLSFSQI